MSKGENKMEKLGKNLVEVSGQFCTPVRVDKPVEAKTRGTGAATKGLMHNKTD